MKYGSREYYQGLLRYSIATDVEIMVDDGFTEQQIIEWFNGPVCREMYDLDHGRDKKTGELVSEVLKNEILPRMMAQA